MQTIKAIIFDMDGVLVNSEEIFEKREFIFLNTITHGKWTKSNQESIRGKTLFDVYKLLNEKFNIRQTRFKFLEKYNMLLTEVYTNEVSLNPGVIELLDALIKTKNKKLAIASSTSKKFIDIVLTRFSLQSYFNIIISSESLGSQHGKPNPDVFLLAAKKLHVKSEECLVIEDSLNGVVAAKRANMYCIAYCNPKNYALKNFADYTVSDLRDIKLIIINLRNTKKSDIEIQSFRGGKIYLMSSESVNKADYYTDFLLIELIKYISHKKGKKLHILEIGTGRGYALIELAKKFKNIELVGTDIDKDSIELATKNVYLNSLEQAIQIKGPGDLFNPIQKGEKFDLVFAALPQMPFTKNFLKSLKNINKYHVTTSAGGEDGQKILTKFIKQAKKFLISGGAIAFVQSDFSSPQKAKLSLDHIGYNNITIKRKKKYLRETTLTKLLKSEIEKKGYKFRKDKKGEEYFNLLTIMAQT